MMCLALCVHRSTLSSVLILHDAVLSLLAAPLLRAHSFTCDYANRLATVSPECWCVCWCGCLCVWGVVCVLGVCVCVCVCVDARSPQDQGILPAGHVWVWLQEEGSQLPSPPSPKGEHHQT